MAALCRLIERAERVPSLADLADKAGMSPSHLHRVFKSVTGLTPRGYAAARRVTRVRNELGRGKSVTEALHESGYGSASRFYAEAGAVLGMTPAAYRAGGVEAEMRHATSPCSLGHVLVAATGRGICAILLGDDARRLARDLRARFPRAMMVAGDAAFRRTVARVVGLVDRPDIGLDLPLDIRGTAFQRRVWQALRDIPAGSTASYAEIARRIGAPRAVRGVAGACAANPLAIAVPCHRVLRSDGGLAGYRWGLERKRALLEREAGATKRSKKTA